jgi:hypothetical protein
MVAEKLMSPLSLMSSSGERRRRKAVVKVRGYAIPGIVMFFIWIVLIALAIILLALIVHWAGGGLLDLRLGHFRLDIGFT